MGKENRSNKKYLQPATNTIPINWYLKEYSRNTTHGGVTFSVTLIIMPDMYTKCEYPIFLDSPRHQIKPWAEDVAKRGLRALIDPKYKTYISQICNYGVQHDCHGLEEHMRNHDPELVDEIVGSNFACMNLGIKVVLPKDCPCATLSKWREKDRESAFRWMKDTVEKIFPGQKSGTYDDKFIYVSIYDEEKLPEQLPNGVVRFNSKAWKGKCQ